MKKVLALTVAITLGATAAFAGSIVGTKHDLSTYQTTGGVKSTSTQICVFCHTPHNAVVNSLLWNRSLPSTVYSVYTSSTNANVKAVLKAGSMGPNNNSILCLSCHDVSTLANIASNMGPSYGTTTDGAAPQMFDGVTTSLRWSNVGAVASGTRSLTNDHPIGFSYGAAVSANTANLKATATAATNLGGTATTVFFNAPAGSDVMECASCHMVHSNDNGKFLRVTNIQSQLCLACHNK